MKIRTVVEGRIYRGDTPAAVFTALRERSPFTRDLTDEAYIAWVWSTFTTEPLPESPAEPLLAKLAEAGMIEFVNDASGAGWSGEANRRDT